MSRSRSSPCDAHRHETPVRCPSPHPSTGSGSRAIALISNWKPYSQVTPTAVSAKVRVFVDWIAELMAQHTPVANHRRGGNGARDARKALAT
ncbi:hypothetical protein [Burkholderia ubonensis]|uniref:hypothetical protein n=2 Tax=Burkholderia ubonensis TaxID=101571 RepID=UPI001E64A6DB|nr:hypothetical protein [Burkholderia ubonensis]